MTTTHPTRRMAGRAAALATLALLTTAPGTSSAQLRPLVRDMLDNLTAVNLIGQAVALDDWDRM